MTKKDTDLDIWMPIYIGDYMADTAHLSTEQHGAYLLLLFAYWKNRGPLPDSDQKLARITKLSMRKWKLNRGVMSEFFEIKNGLWHQKRADEEIERSTRVKKTRSAIGQAGAAARWGEKDAIQSNAPGIAKALPQALPQASEMDAPGIHSHSHSNQERTEGGESVAATVASPPSGLSVPQILEQGCNLLGVKLTDSVKRLAWPGEIAALVRQGCDPEAHILQAFRVAVDRGKAPDVGIAYIAAVARSLRDEAARPSAPRAAAASAPVESPREDRLRMLVRLFRDRGIWSAAEGPQPDHPDCCIDQKILAEFGYGKAAA